MPTNFPDSPSLNQGHIAGTSSFVWTGRSWDRGPAGVIVPPPVLTDITPDTTPVTTSPTMTLTGTGFTTTSKVRFGALEVSASFVSATELTCTVPPNPTAEILQVAVVDGVQTSNELPFEWTALVVPTLISLVPDECEIYTSPAVVVNGTNFTATSMVRFGNTTIPPVFVSSTVLNINAPASPVTKIVQVTVFDGPAVSNALPFEYLPSTGPTVTSLEPPETAINTTPQVLINGTNFTAASIARFDGLALTTTFLSATQLRVTAPTSPVVKTSQVNVINGAVLSNSVPFRYTVPLDIFSLNPPYQFIDGVAREITITGSGFTPTCAVYMDFVAQATIYVSATQVKFTAPGSTVEQQKTLSVYDSASGNSSASSLMMRWIKSVTVTSIDPNPIAATSTGNVLNVRGTGFDASTYIVINSVAPASGGGAYGTTLVSSTHLQTTLVTWDMAGISKTWYVNATASLSPDQVLTLTGGP